MDMNRVPPDENPEDNSPGQPAAEPERSAVAPAGESEAESGWRPAAPPPLTAQAQPPFASQPLYAPQPSQPFQPPPDSAAAGPSAFPPSSPYYPSYTEAAQPPVQGPPPQAGPGGYSVAPGSYPAAQPPPPGYSGYGGAIGYPQAPPPPENAYPGAMAGGAYPPGAGAFPRGPAAPPPPWSGFAAQGAPPPQQIPPSWGPPPFGYPAQGQLPYGGPSGPGGPFGPPSGGPGGPYGPPPGGPGGWRAAPPRPPQPGSPLRRKIIIGAVVGGVLLVVALIALSSSLSDAASGLSLNHKIGLLEVEGAIADESNLPAASRDLVRTIRKWSEDSSIRGIVVRINSPGGTVAATQEIHDELMRFRNKTGRPVVASMGDIAASGGYYTAAACQEIYANPGTLTGSIGVILSFANVEDLTKKIGVRFEVVKSGKFKDIGSMNRPMTGDERELLQALIHDVHKQFVDAVIDGREKAMRRILVERKSQSRAESKGESAEASEETPESGNSGNGEDESKDEGNTALAKNAEDQSMVSIRARRSEMKAIKAITVSDDEISSHAWALADGRIYSGTQALDEGLVDRLGTLQDAVARVQILAKLEGKPKIVSSRIQRGLFEALSGETKTALREMSPGRVALEYRFILP